MIPPTISLPPGVLKENRRCIIALPWYRAAHPLTTVALLQLFQRDTMSIKISFGDAFIAHARNKLATKFLETKFEWMLMLDDDMVPPCGNAAWFHEQSGLKVPEWSAGLNTIERLISHGKTLVGATYFGRSPGAPPVFAEGMQRKAELLQTGPRNEVIPTKWIGTGCLLFHRSVFEDIEKHFPHLSRGENGGTGQWFTSSEHDLHNSIRRAIQTLTPNPTGMNMGAETAAIKILQEGLHRSSVHSSLGMGEDVSLCVRATQSGHTPHVDLGLWAAHFGPRAFPEQF